MTRDLSFPTTTLDKFRAPSQSLNVEASDWKFSGINVDFDVTPCDCKTCLLFIEMIEKVEVIDNDREKGWSHHSGSGISNVARKSLYNL